jgi:hypothetical protein
MNVEDHGGLCCIKGCDLPVLAVGLCNKHWRRMKKNGSPVLFNRTSGFFIGKSPEERFFMQVEKSDGCWIWQAAKDKDGYGMFKGSVAGETYTRAHRFSYSFHTGEIIPEGMSVMHSCDNPSCVNPDHLSIGTTLENQRDKWKRGRGKVRFGESSPHCKLTEDQVREIRASTEKQSDMAKRLGVTQTTISEIRRRVSWSHLKD